MTEATKEIVKAEPKQKLVALAELLQKTDNPWTEIPKFKTNINSYDDYNKALNHCRFFYRTEPVVSTVIDKLVELGINDIVFSQNNLSNNEYRVFLAIKPKLLEFAEQMAAEYLLSGLVVPEIGYNKVDKDFLFSLGIKKLTSLELPDSMWVRDPSTIKINMSMVADKPTYYVKIPDSIAYFIKNKGKYPDGKEDKELFKTLTKEYPDFVKDVNSGKKEVLLENKYVFRRKYTSDNPYPIPYINSSLEALHHKRKMRRMDYTLMDKVISAIMHIKVGSDEFPLTESPEDQEVIASLQNQLKMRGRNEDVLERVFQLLTNHTVDISWIFPNVEILLNSDKYADINQEILFGLGFPRFLITGETLRSGTSDPEIASLSPMKTAEGFRRRILEVIKGVCLEISKRNGFNSVPSVGFKPINLHKFADFLSYLTKLYDSSAISRTTLANEFGYDFTTEIDLLANEMAALKGKGLPEFGTTPNSKNSVLLDQSNPQDTTNTDTTNGNKTTPTSKKGQKPAKTTNTNGNGG